MKWKAQQFPTSGREKFGCDAEASASEEFQGTTDGKAVEAGNGSLDFSRQG